LIVNRPMAPVREGIMQKFQGTLHLMKKKNKVQVF